MKTLFTFFLCLSLFAVKAQNDCSTAYQYCGNNITLPLITNVPDMGVANCMSSTPNAAWFFFQVDQGTNAAASLQIDGFDQGSSSSLDIDLAVMGPYATIDCAAITDSLNDNPYAFCDYSTSGNISVNFSNVQAGEYYIILITNFSNQPAYAQFTETGSTFTFVQNNCISEVEEGSEMPDFDLSNPFSDILYVNNLPSDKYVFNIYDASGKLILNKSDSETSLELSTKEYQNGLYIVELLHRGNMIRKKVIKTN